MTGYVYKRSRMVQAVAELILTLLDGRWHARHFLADSLGVCGRTISRNIATLEAAGFPIETELHYHHPGPPVRSLQYRLNLDWLARRSRTVTALNTIEVRSRDLHR